MALSFDELQNIYIATQYIRHHKTLDYYIQRKDRVQNSVKAQIMFELAKTLAYLHKTSPGVVHRDLKPCNVYITNDFSIKLAGLE